MTMLGGDVAEFFATVTKQTLSSDDLCEASTRLGYRILSVIHIFGGDYCEIDFTDTVGCVCGADFTVKKCVGHV